jgi:hypothetical protein
MISSMYFTVGLLICRVRVSAERGTTGMTNDRPADRQLATRFSRQSDPMPTGLCPQPEAGVN